MFSLLLRGRLLLRILAVIFAVDVEKQQLSNSKKVLIDTIQVSYSKSGTKKEKIILLHGWGQSKETWKDIILVLQKYYTVYALDLPGFGASDIPVHSFSLKEYTNILNLFMEKMKIHKTIVVGHSFGGKIAVAFTCKYSQKVTKLILYSSDLGIERNILGNTFSRSLKMVDNKLLEVVVKVYLSFRKKSYQRFHFLSETYRNCEANYAEKLRIVVVPVLLLYGKYDFVTQLSSGKKIHEFTPNSRFVIFGKSSHLAHLEEKNKFIEELI